MQSNNHYKTIAGAIRWMAEHWEEQPDLRQLAEQVGVSPHHLQRTFQSWAGVSPKQFLKSLTRRAALERLEAGSSVLDAALSVGLSGPGRLHDLLVSTDALTPGEVSSRGAGIVLEYGIGASPFGKALVAWNSRGLNFLAFCEERGPAAALAELGAQWTNARYVEARAGARSWLDRIFCGSGEKPIPVWLRGSPFQLKVWEALLAIPDGALASYGDLARRIGRPAAARAVGSAVGANPIAWVIPCHRVIRQAGELGSYRWGSVTKRALIGFEAARGLRGGVAGGLAQVEEYA